VKKRYVFPLIVGSFIGGMVTVVKFGPRIFEKYLAYNEIIKLRMSIRDTIADIKAKVPQEDLAGLKLPGDPGFKPADIGPLLDKAGIPRSDFEALITNSMRNRMGTPPPPGWDDHLRSELWKDEQDENDDYEGAEMGYEAAIRRGMEAASRVRDGKDYKDQPTASDLR
jgi:hypothetical protein